MSAVRTGLSRVALALAMTISVGAIPQLAHTQEAQKPQRFRFDLQAGPMSDTLARFSEMSGIQLVYSSDLVKGMQSAGLTEELSGAEALTRLLKGTGLVARFSTPTTASLVSAASTGSRVLGPVRVEGADQGAPQRGEGVAQLGGVRGGQDQEARGLRPVVAAVGAGAPVAIEDIPRSVSVLTQEQMEAQDIQDFSEAIRRLPGLSLTDRFADASYSAASEAGTVTSRGFAITTMQVDGGAPRYLDIINNGLFNLSSFERVELVRGPNGVFSGTGSPGGSINLVRKRPGGDPTLDVSVTGGSFNRYQGLVDWSTPNIFGTPLAFRGVASYEDQKFKWDNDHLKRSSLYGVIDMPLGERARFEVGGQYQNIRQNGLYQASYRYYDGPNLALPFYFNYTPEWSYVDAETMELFSRFYVRLLEQWNFDIGVTHAKVDKLAMDSMLSGGVNLLSNTNEAYQICEDGVCTPRGTYFFARENFLGTENLGVDFKVTGKFRTWGLEHNVYLAGDLNERLAAETEVTFNEPDWPQIFTLADFARLPNFGPARALLGSFSAQGTEFKLSESAYGLTISDVISWRERIALTLSARLQDQEESNGTLTRRHFDASPIDIGLNEINSGNIDRAETWRPSWALAVKPWPNLTVYGSYSESSQDQSTRFTADGSQLAPRTFENSELGVKYGLAGWLLSASGYRLEQDNVATSIPGSRGQCGPTPTSPCYFLGGATIESSGYDIEMSGRLFDQLDLQLSYTYNETTQVSTDLPVDTRSPAKLAKLFANWDLPWVADLSLNLGAVYTGRIFEEGTRSIYDPVTFALLDQFSFNYEEASTLIWDVGVDYALNDNIDITLLVENVAGTEYYSTVGSTQNHVGNPRTAMLRVTWRDGGDRSGFTRSPTTGLAPFGDPADWYGALETGRQFPEDWQARSSGAGPSGTPINWTFETTPSEAFFARLGYRLNEHWRTEGEFGVRQHGFGKIGGNDTAPYGLCGVDYATAYLGTSRDRMTSCYDPQGEAMYWSFFANVIRDFGAPDSRLRPFLGVGIGATRASVDFSGRFDGYTDTAYREWYQSTYGMPLSAPYSPVAPGEKLLGSEASWGLSYQLTAGLSWRVTDRATVDVTYKYTRDKLDIKTANLTDYYPRDNEVDYMPEPPYFIPEPNRLSGAGLPQLRSFKGDLESSIFTVGLRWAFGAPH